MTKDLSYKQGERVLHPKESSVNWGLGEVLEASNGDTVRVFFVGSGEKTLVLNLVQPIRVPKDEASHPVLDNLLISTNETGIKYQSLENSIDFFLQTFPEGFYGQKFEENERAYKVEANKLADELLNKNDLSKLCENEGYSEIVVRALKVVNKTNLIFPNEKMSLKDGLKSEATQKEFSLALYSLLFGEEELKPRFEAFSKVLESIDAGKWTIATYFLFIAHPDKFMFVKPTVTQHSSALCGYDVHYTPRLNWQTYRSVLGFSEYLMSALSDLNPRDMIDVQSFMWCIAPGKY